MAYQPRHPRPVGRPRKLLEPGVRDNLIKSLRLGVTVGMACDSVSVSRSAFFGWMQRGNDEFEDRAAGEEPNPEEDVFHDLFLEVKQARGEAAIRNVGVIQKSAQGGALTNKTTKRYRDPDTGAMVEEESETRTAPDWRAAAWWLERTFREEYGKEATQVEVTGAGGGPVKVDNAESLAARLAEHLAAGVGAAALLELSNGGDDVHDVEVIEDRTT